MKVRNRFTRQPGVVTRVFFEQYPNHVYHEHCVDLTAYGYPPAMLIPRVEVTMHGSVYTVGAWSFSHYFEKEAK